MLNLLRKHHSTYVREDRIPILSFLFNFIHSLIHSWQSRNSVLPVHALINWLKRNWRMLNLFRKHHSTYVREDRIPNLSFLFNFIHSFIHDRVGTLSSRSMLKHRPRINLRITHSNQTLLHLPLTSYSLPLTSHSWFHKRKKASHNFLYEAFEKRRLSTLPQNCSTIDVDRLNFSVRNGKRWNPVAITT